MGGWIERPAGLLRFPALDQFEHFLIVRVFEFPDTVLLPLVTFFHSFKYAEPSRSTG